MFATGLLALAALAPVDTPREEEIKKELAKLHGVWKLMSRESRGRVMATPTPDRYGLVISGDACVFYLYGGVIKIDPSKLPRTIDLSINNGRYAGRNMLGVYELSGDVLKLALPSSAARADPRPAAVKSDETSMHILYTFQRDAKVAKEAVAAELKQKTAGLAAGGPDAAVRPALLPNQDVLQKILERLDKIDQRLEVLEKKLTPAEHKK